MGESTVTTPPRAPRQASLPLDDPLVAETLDLASSLPRDVLVGCRDLLHVLTRCDHEELADVRQLLTAVRQLPGTPPGAQAVMRLGADLVRALDRAQLARGVPED